MPYRQRAVRRRSIQRRAAFDHGLAQRVEIGSMDRGPPPFAPGDWNGYVDQRRARQRSPVEVNVNLRVAVEYRRKALVAGRLALLGQNVFDVEEIVERTATRP